MADNKSCEGTKNGIGELTIHIGVSEAIKGLKALQREAKKAVAALRELDNIKKHTCPKCERIGLKIKTLTIENEKYKQDKRCVECGWYE